MPATLKIIDTFFRNGSVGYAPLVIVHSDYRLGEPGLDKTRQVGT
jgi:hypothetical protein